MSRWQMLVAAPALAALGLALVQLGRAGAGLERTGTTVGTTPVTVLRARGAPAGPAVVIAHGFAGSRQLMLSFAETVARNGYVAVSLDFLGHGRNPAPLTGDITKESGATQALLAELLAVTDFAAALPGVEGRVALLGHSMASDIVVRGARADPRVEAVVAVSMFSREVTAERPRNLLMIAGEWESFLRQEALGALALAAGGAPVAEGRTVGDPSGAGGRRAAVAPHVEHVSVLYSSAAMAETVAWLDAVFGRTSSGWVAARGPWVGLMLAAVVALGWPLAGLLPRLAAPPAGAGLGWRPLLGLSAGAAVLTPLLLWPVPTGFLPVLVADYLAVHFALYGVLTGLGLLWLGRGPAGLGGVRVLGVVGLGAAVAAVVLAGLGSALDAQVVSFWPQGGRWAVIGALFLGILPYMLADEWAGRGAGSPRLGAAASRLAFLLSLAIAVALDLEELFFLIIILPVILVFFVVFGTMSGWVYRRTGEPAVAALANAAIFAWALGVTFPMLGG